MELRQLRYFVTVAHELNFTRAAARLHVAQPALSRQVTQLEDELGGPLLERDKRSVRLTARGESFLREAEGILEHAEAALANARSGAQRKLNIGYVWGLFHSTAPAAMQRLRASDPALSLNLLDMPASEQARALASGRLDFGFIGTAFEAEAAALEMQRIGRCAFKIVVPRDHRFARRSTIDLGAFANELFLLISEDHYPGASRVMRSACEAAGFNPRVLQTAERGHAIIGMVAAGCGVAILPETLDALPHEGVNFRSSARPIESDLYLAWRKGLDEAVVKRMLGSISE
jgi:DNA-binding transcriptional LysR family regulator